jgi:ABC-type Na+ transport system ATPase subunit NatA
MSYTKYEYCRCGFDELPDGSVLICYIDTHERGMHYIQKQKINFPNKDAMRTHMEKTENINYFYSLTSD